MPKPAIPRSKSPDPPPSPSTSTARKNVSGSDAPSPRAIATASSVLASSPVCRRMYTKPSRNSCPNERAARSAARAGRVYDMNTSVRADTKKVAASRRNAVVVDTAASRKPAPA